MAPETCPFNGLFPPTFTSPLSRGGAPLMQRAETGSTALSVVLLFTFAPLLEWREHPGGEQGTIGSLFVRNWGSCIRAVQMKMAVVIRIIYLTVLIVCCQRVLGQSLSLGKCPSYPAIKKLDLKKVCTSKLVYFIFLIYKIRSFRGFHSSLTVFFFHLRWYFNIPQSNRLTRTIIPECVEVMKIKWWSSGLLHCVR